MTSSGYADENGYGHEEWNGRDDWVWRGWRVFDTQSQPRRHDYAATGDLGIIMITVVGGRPCVVGAACNVYSKRGQSRDCPPPCPLSHVTVPLPALYAGVGADGGGGHAAGLCPCDRGGASVL
jgi:hypothetical protein